MLIDVFARRYAETPLRGSFGEQDRRLLVQAFRILSEDIYPYYRDGKEDSTGVAFWTNLHSRLSRELGLSELSPIWFSTTTKWNGNDVRQTHKHPMVRVCENWMLSPILAAPDQQIKERLSLIELGFRQKETELAAMNAAPITVPAAQATALIGDALRMPVPANASDRVRAWRAERTAAFRYSVEELNARFRQAGYSLHHHNGFIQVSTDVLVQETVETPFWALVGAPPWQNVELDMKEALDLRDSDGRDPAFYAARALESAVKIISGLKGWTHGGEKGAHNFVDNLAARKNAFLAPWEAANLKDFFTHVRNPIGHGAGSDQMPRLLRPQTEWAIEFCMSWIKNLIRRL